MLAQVAQEAVVAQKEGESRMTEGNGVTQVHICLSARDDCKNIEESWGMTCVRCNKCGRFDDQEEDGAEEPEEQFRALVLF